MLRVLGKARIQHADTGVVYKIDKDSLDFDFDEDREREIRRGAQIEYNAIFDHPQLGRLTWTVVEASFDSIEHHDYNVQNHVLLKNFGFILSDEISDADGDEEDDEDRIAEMISWFHENFEEPHNLPYDKELGYLWQDGGPFNANDELQENFPDEDYNIVEVAVKKIESSSFEWAPIFGTKYFDDGDYQNEEPIIGDNLKEIDNDLNTLIDTAPAPTTDPAFALGNDNRLHIIPPPDNQPVDSQDDLLNELRTITDDLLQSLRGANFHQDLIPIIEKYKEAISGNQMSISRLYGRGVRLDNIVRVIKRGIEANEQPPLSLNTESNLNSVLEIHGAYIMSSADGRQLEQDAVDYHHPPEQPEGFKEAVEKFSNSIKNNTALFDESVREYVPNIVMDIGIRQPQKRSDKIGERTLTNFVSALIKGIGKIGVKAIQWITVSAIRESTPGQIAITATTNRINAIWDFLTNNAPSLKTITDYLSPESSWLESASKIILRIISMIMGE